MKETAFQILEMFSNFACKCIINVTEMFIGFVGSNSEINYVECALVESCLLTGSTLFLYIINTSF